LLRDEEGSVVAEEKSVELVFCAGDGGFEFLADLISGIGALVQSLLENTDDFSFDVLLGDEFYLLFDFVALVDTALHESTGTGCQGGEGLLVGSEHIQQLFMIQYCNFSEVAW
jgi:hypothetical protein